MAKSSLIWRLKTFFILFCNEVNNIRTMMDEAMVNTRTLPLLLQAIFFTKQNVGIPFLNYFASCGTQHETR